MLKNEVLGRKLSDGTFELEVCYPEKEASLRLANLAEGNFLQTNYILSLPIETDDDIDYIATLARFLSKAAITLQVERDLEQRMEEHDDRAAD